MYVKDCVSQPRSVDFSVPQGSILGPVLFNAYSSTFEQYILDYNVGLCGYVDDHGAHKHFDPRIQNSEISTITELENCMDKIHQLMSENRLKMNPNKTEFILFGSRE